MPIAYATSEPAAEPRPGPTAMPCPFAHMMKSATTRKYAGNPICTMVSISYSASLRCSSSYPFGKRHSMPCQTCDLKNSASDSKPSGIGKRGIRLRNSNIPAVSTREATSSWLLRQPSCQASDWSSAYISAADLM